MCIEDVDYRKDGGRLCDVEGISIAREKHASGIRGDRTSDGIERRIENVKLLRAVRGKKYRVSAAVGIGRNFGYGACAQATRTCDDVAMRIEQRDFSASVTRAD